MSAPTEYLFDTHFSYTAFDGWLFGKYFIIVTSNNFYLSIH